MCGPDCNASACLLMEAAGDCHHQRTSACTDQEKKKRGRSGNWTPSWQQQSQPQINIFVGDWTKTPNS